MNFFNIREYKKYEEIAIKEITLNNGHTYYHPLVRKVEENWYGKRKGAWYLLVLIQNTCEKILYDDCKEWNYFLTKGEVEKIISDYLHQESLKNINNIKFESINILKKI